MSIITVSKVTMGFLDNILFSEASFDINKGDKIGLIGANGTGKTTLLKLLTGELEPVNGNIFVSKYANIGYISQFGCEGSENCALDELMSVFSELFALEEEIEIINEMVRQSPSQELIEKQARLQEKFADMGGLTFSSRGKSTFLGLGFTLDDASLPVKNLSGGQRTKLSLGKLLLSNADLLLLDEPTNHLDIKSVEWLEDFLSQYNGAAVIISHDRYFLDKITNKTMEIRNKRISIKKGSYSEFVKLRNEQAEAQKRQYDNTSAEIKRIKGIIEQQRGFNRERNFITIESKKKQIARLEETLPDIDYEPDVMRLKFKVSHNSGNDVLIAENLCKSFDKNILFDNVSFKIKRGERIFLIGPNGCGKSTLLKIILGKIKPDRGIFYLGSSLRIGYFDQNQESLLSTSTIVEEINSKFPQYTVPQIRGMLAGFLFKGEDVFKKMNELSGGERARTELLELSLKQPNFLILDEPTNYLDIESKEVLESALKEYDGTILCVSHDRYFINSLATRILCFDGTTITTLDGNYDTYIQGLKAPETTVKQEKKVNEYVLKKKQASDSRKLQTKIKRLEEDITTCEKSLEEIENDMLQYASDYEKIMELTQRLSQTKERQDELYSEYFSLLEQ